VLPRRLSYPELLPVEMHDSCLYTDFEGLLARLRGAIRESGVEGPAGDDMVGRYVAKFDWAVQAPLYDALLLSMA
jgi:hypothetical protein